MIIGICGKSGSGKSTIAHEIVKNSKNKAVHIDIDEIGHKVLIIKEVQEKLIKSFGKYIVNSTTIDRRKLGKIVFNSSEEMDKLSEITWNYMQEEIDKFIDENKEKIIILDWILLPNSKYFQICDVRILLDISYEIRKERAIKRDKITSEAFDLREKASIDYDKTSFEYVINENDNEKIKRLVKLI